MDAIKKDKTRVGKSSTGVNFIRLNSEWQSLLSPSEPALTPLCPEGIPEDADKILAFVISRWQSAVQSRIQENLR